VVDAEAWIMIALDGNQIAKHVSAWLSDREPIQTLTPLMHRAVIAFDVSSVSLSWLVLTWFA